MKKIKCLDCDEMFEGETPEAVQASMHPHYMEAHKDVMAEGTDEKMKAWFAHFKKVWEEAPEQ